MTSPAVFRE
uniref:Uncharacterized protein n=1 Tax=Rhizophora mucronata TaxID=61149 RepID=A0A2P2QYI8_RHIMU